jgi:hypothetical protein
MSTWRVGSKVPINVYDGDRPVCQCHTVEDAVRIVAAVNRQSDVVPAAEVRSPVDPKTARKRELAVKAANARWGRK